MARTSSDIRPWQILLALDRVSPRRGVAVPTTRIAEHVERMDAEALDLHLAILASLGQVELDGPGCVVLTGSGFYRARKLKAEMHRRQRLATLAIPFDECLHRIAIRQRSTEDPDLDRLVAELHRLRKLVARERRLRQRS